MEKTNLTIAKDHTFNQPSNIEAEQSLLGSVLVNNEIIDEISSIINFEKFFDPAHKKIYKIIETLNNKGMIANPITIKNFFENDKDSSLSDVGGSEYLVKLTRFSASTRQAIEYSKIIHENFVKRELLRISEEITLNSTNQNLDKSAENILLIRRCRKIII